jgi:hypothetical protein
MSAYANTGDLSKAVVIYERFSQGLQKDLGVKPSEQTQDLYKRLKAGEMLDVPRKGTQPTRSRADIASPLFDLYMVRHSDLPRLPTSFIGGEKEILQIEQLVSRARLVAITCTGGVGKTRLAIQATGVLAPQFRDGVW